MKSKQVAERLGGGVLLRGWHLDGPGPARFGWAAPEPAGGVRWLGRTLRAISERLDKSQAEWQEKELRWAAEWASREADKVRNAALIEDERKAGLYAAWLRGEDTQRMQIDSANRRGTGQ